jgi:hypothetical protein
MATRTTTETNAPQWILALETTHDSDVPLLVQPLGGNGSDKVELAFGVQVHPDVDRK